MAMRYSDVTRGLKRDQKSTKSHGFLHKIKQQNEVLGFSLRKINDWQMISPLKDLGVVKI